MFCGLLRLGALAVVGGRCPFCIGDDRKRMAKRMGEFVDPQVFWKHLKRHFDISLFPRRCPHPRCIQISRFKEIDLARHFYDTHGLSEAMRIIMERRKSSSKTAQSNDIDTCDNETYNSDNEDVGLFVTEESEDEKSNEDPKHTCDATDQIDMLLPQEDVPALSSSSSTSEQNIHTSGEMSSFETTKKQRPGAMILDDLCWATDLPRSCTKVSCCKFVREEPITEMLWLDEASAEAPILFDDWSWAENLPGLIAPAHYILGITKDVGHGQHVISTSRAQKRKRQIAPYECAGKDGEADGRWRDLGTTKTLETRAAAPVRYKRKIAKSRKSKRRRTSLSEEQLTAEQQQLFREALDSNTQQLAVEG